MKEKDRQLLEDILTADILILAALMRQKAENGSPRRTGGDYTQEAVNEIKRARPTLIDLLRH